MADDAPITMGEATPEAVAIMDYLARRTVTTAEGVKALRRSHDNLLEALKGLVEATEHSEDVGTMLAVQIARSAITRSET